MLPKLLTITLVMTWLMILSTTVIVHSEAHPTYGSPTVVSKRSNITCPLDVVSCSKASQGIDKCCLPENGLLLLVQQWKLDIGPKDGFTIHGLWPDYCDGRATAKGGCDPSRSHKSGVEGILMSFQDQEFMKAMNDYWPSSGNTKDWFWSHEWTSHGTCLSTLAPACNPTYKAANQDIYTYFDLVLNLRHDNDIYDALSKAGIQPGSFESVEDWHKAIKIAFGVDANLYCQSQTIQEVWLYFNVVNKSHYVRANSLPPKNQVGGGLAPCQGKIFYPRKYNDHAVTGNAPMMAATPTAVVDGFDPTVTGNIVPAPTIGIDKTFDPFDPIDNNPNQPPPPPPPSSPPLPPSYPPPPSSGSFPFGRQTGTCSTLGATVCVGPNGSSNQYSKCVNGKWILNSCKAKKFCMADSATATHCA